MNVLDTAHETGAQYFDEYFVVCTKICQNNDYKIARETAL